MKKRTYSFQLALSESDIVDYFDLRQQIFCEEQGLFKDNDRDAIDRASRSLSLNKPCSSHHGRYL